MLINDYDEFNIYSNIEEIENYVGQLIQEGIELKEEIYSKCLDHFGLNYKTILDDLFNEKD